MATVNRKPTQRKVTLKTLADYANRGLKPEREDKVYEFGNGTKGKKAGAGVYEELDGSGWVE